MLLTNNNYSMPIQEKSIKEKIAELKNKEFSANRLAKRAKIAQHIIFKQYEMHSRERNVSEFALCGQDPHRIAERYQKLILTIKEEVDIETAVTAIMRDNPQSVINALIASLNYYVDQQVSVIALCQEKTYLLKHQLNLFDSIDEKSSEIV